MRASVDIAFAGESLWKERCSESRAAWHERGHKLCFQLLSTARTQSFPQRINRFQSESTAFRVLLKGGKSRDSKTEPTGAQEAEGSSGDVEKELEERIMAATGKR